LLVNKKNSIHISYFVPGKGYDKARINQLSLIHKKEHQVKKKLNFCFFQKAHFLVLKKSFQ
jgi:hypothetical protein